jgi:hypothetical protein
MRKILFGYCYHLEMVAPKIAGLGRLWFDRQFVKYYYDFCVYKIDNRLFLITTTITTTTE